MRDFAPLDLIVLLVYLAGVTLWGAWLGRKQRGGTGYFLGNRELPWGAVLLSVVATETSTLTFLSIPGVAYLGNLGFLQLTLGYLVGRVIISGVLLPGYYRGELNTAYALLERRFGTGTRRFTSGVRSIDTLKTQTRLGDLVAGQEPFAVILGCSDSRVPVEIVFDQGLGDLFVIRVAGNIVAPSQIGSVEFAAQRFGTRLVVILGHTRCGAVQATLEELQQPNTQPSRNLSSIVDRIRPSVEGLLATELRHDHEALAQQGILANVRVSANDLRHGSAILERMIQREGLLVVGAEYSLETVVVDFFDGVPATV
jgi:carbonic anhydrase